MTVNVLAYLLLSPLHPVESSISNTQRGKLMTQMRRVVPMPRNPSRTQLISNNRCRAEGYALLITESSQSTEAQHAREVLSAWAGSRPPALKRLNVVPGSYMPGET
jgi:hypothetical protein